jgi:hypothetical protein
MGPAQTTRPHFLNAFSFFIFIRLLDRINLFDKYFSLYSERQHSQPNSISVSNNNAFDSFLLTKTPVLF